MFFQLNTCVAVSATFTNTSGMVK